MTRARLLAEASSAELAGWQAVARIEARERAEAERKRGRRSRLE